MLELRPFEGAQDRIMIEGPTVSLRTDVASILVLLLHELTSNAVKYGALSNLNGQVKVRWAFERGGLAIFWREVKGPQVEKPGKRGFGRSIIEDALRFEFKWHASLRFLPDGVEADFWLPGNVINDLEREHQKPVKPKVGAVTTKAPMITGVKQALVVEDNFVVAMMAKRLLLDEGFAQVDIASSMDEALGALTAQEYQFCLLDLNLQGELSAPVARYLQKEGIPFVFATG